jgi:hypothetical protein
VATEDCGGGAWECRGVFTSFPALGVCVDHGVCGDGGAGQYANCDACGEAESQGCCSAESAECVLGTPCDVFASCLAGCAVDDTACIDACVTATPDGVTPYVQYSRCILGDPDQGFLGACGSVCPQ